LKIDDLSCKICGYQYIFTDISKRPYRYLQETFKRPYGYLKETYKRPYGYLQETSKRPTRDLQETFMAFYENLNDFFENHNLIKTIVNKGASINSLHSKIIKDYKDKMKGSEEYFEDKVLASFNEYAEEHFKEAVGIAADASDASIAADASDTSIAADASSAADASYGYDDICNNIIFIYYRSVVELNEYYSGIYRKQRFML
jgi:hypothetical protein